MYKILLSSVLSFLITFFSIPAIIRIAKAKKLFAPSNEFYVSKSLVPALGGVAIFAGFISSILIFIHPIEFPSLQLLVGSVMIIFFLGLKEDIQILSFSKKIAGQIIAAIILVYFGNFQINNLFGLFGVNEISYFSSILISLTSILIIINSFIFMGSIDGLSGIFGLLSAVIFGSYFYLCGDLSFSIVAFSLAAGLFSFLFFNFSPAKMFIGSTGSLLIGLVHSVLFIKFINTSGNPSAPFSIASSPALAFAILMFPIFETIKIFILSTINNKSTGHKKFLIHHLLIEMGYSNNNAILILVSTNMSVVLLAFIFNNFGTTFLMGSILAIGAVGSFIIYQKYEKISTEKEINGFANQHAEIKKINKILTIYNETVDTD